MRVRWTPSAAADLQQISEFLQANHTYYRQSTLRKLYDSIRALAQFPYQGRPGAEPGTRELLLLPLPYIAVYRIRDESLEVLRVLHTSRGPR